MIPLRDNVGASRLSPINLSLITLNVAVFIYEVHLGAGVGALIWHYGLIPARLSAIGQMAPRAAAMAAFTLLSFQFLHGGVLHIAGNMLYLFIFGPAVEARFGRLRYLLFYLLAGAASGLAMVAMEPSLRIPTVGASGAIAAVLGAYFILYPGARLLTLLPLLVIVEFIEVPAVLYLLLWFGIQLYEGLRSQGAAGIAGGVAWWAHVGGFLVGIAIAPLAARRRQGAKAIALRR